MRFLFIKKPCLWVEHVPVHHQCLGSALGRLAGGRAIRMHQAEGVKEFMSEAADPAAAAGHLRRARLFAGWHDWFVGKAPQVVGGEDGQRAGRRSRLPARMIGVNVSHHAFRGHFVGRNAKLLGATPSRPSSSEVFRKNALSFMWRCPDRNHAAGRSERTAVTIGEAKRNVELSRFCASQA
jgi:hypothetical protein